mmetsp:Transcript_39367/g.125144  ORF Transcript_39367/g.125144 Transcript_39367/m.125144 type:complete len:209 (-) Transcript_39367:249-875(-)
MQTSRRGRQWKKPRTWSRCQLPHCHRAWMCQAAGCPWTAVPKRPAHLLHWRAWRGRTTPPRAARAGLQARRGPPWPPRRARMAALPPAAPAAGPQQRPAAVPRATVAWAARARLAAGLQRAPRRTSPARVTRAVPGTGCHRCRGQNGQLQARAARASAPPWRRWNGIRSSPLGSATKRTTSSGVGLQAATFGGRQTPFGSGSGQTLNT